MIHVSTRFENSRPTKNRIYIWKLAIHSDANSLLFLGVLPFVHVGINCAQTGENGVGPAYPAWSEVFRLRGRVLIWKMNVIHAGVRLFPFSLIQGRSREPNAALLFFFRKIYAKFDSCMTIWPDFLGFLRKTSSCFLQILSNSRAQWSLLTADVPRYSFDVAVYIRKTNKTPNLYQIEFNRFEKS